MTGPSAVHSEFFLQRCNSFFHRRHMAQMETHVMVMEQRIRVLPLDQINGMRTNTISRKMQQSV